MPSYLLPCTCGEQTPVSAVEAGRSIRCVCGARLEVPNMRELRSLERAEPAAATVTRSRTAAWDNRHRLAFLFVLAAVCGLATAGYLAAQLPVGYVGPSMSEIDEWLGNSSTEQVFEVYQDLQKGLTSQTSAAEPIDHTRTAVLWGMGIVLATSTLALVAAAAVVMRTGRERIR